MELSPRRLKILSAIVRTHINTGEPVGSKAVSELLDINVSSATIRNEMAVLVELGFLEQPHTSAGRVPSHIGYRLYVDRLMDPDPLTDKEKNFIDSFFNVKAADPEKLIEETGAVLAELTNCVAVSTTLASKGVTIERIEMVCVGRHTYVLLLVTSMGFIKNKVCKTDFDIPPKAVVYFLNFVQEKCGGLNMDAVDAALIQRLLVEMGEYSLMFTPFVLAIYELCREAAGGDVHMEGQTNLFSYSEFTRNAGELLRFLEDRDKVAELMRLADSALSVIIGKEIKEDELSESSMVVAKYHIGNEGEGAIGIIGPQRMDYARIIPRLAYFSKLLGNLLSEELLD